LQTSSGAEAEAGAAAAAPVDAEPKAAVAKGAAAADPGGAGAGPAPAAEQSREATEGPASDRKAGPEGGTQPEETLRPPVAGPLTRALVVSVSRNGRRRAGQAFGPEPVELHVSDATLELLRGDPQLIVKVG
jgi:hypothetical protein